ncbi:MAG: YfiR family protein [Candidatus Latescibacterota bacterium]
MSMHGIPVIFAQSPPVREYQVKAAFLFRFANFVDWPDRAFQSKESGFVIGVLGDNPFGEALDSLKGKTIKGRRVVVRNYTEVEDALNCQVLFISGSENDNLPSIIKSLSESPVLTVGDREGFCRKGVMINMVPVEKNIGFEVNDSAARRAGLRISSQLLKLAQKIYE